MKKRNSKVKKLLKTGSPATWTRRGVVLVAFLAVFVFVVNIISASFSWFTPYEGNKMGYQGSYTFRSETCTMTTDVGEMYTYDKSQNKTDHFTGYIDYKTPQSQSIPVAGNGGRAYFRTIITNSSTTDPSNISLYIKSFPAQFSIGVESPTNSYRAYATPQTNLHIVRNAYVKKFVATEIDPGVLMIDWFVVNNSNGEDSIDLSNLYLVYN